MKYMVYNFLTDENQADTKIDGICEAENEALIASYLKKNILLGRASSSPEEVFIKKEGGVISAVYTWGMYQTTSGYYFEKWEAIPMDQLPVKKLIGVKSGDKDLPF